MHELGCVQLYPRQATSFIDEILKGDVAFFNLLAFAVAESVSDDRRLTLSQDGLQQSFDEAADPDDGECISAMLSANFCFSDPIQKVLAGGPVDDELA